MDLLARNVILMELLGSFSKATYKLRKLKQWYTKWLFKILQLFNVVYRIK